MFEMIITPIIVGMGIVLYVLIRNDNDAINECVQLNKQINDLQTRIAKLENEAKYYADQPQFQGGFFAAGNAYNYDWGVVPLNSVVKAIVNHLDMQIEKVPEQTVTKPVEVKVVEKKPSVTIVGANGNTGTTWANPIPPEKPKRKYTKRKSK